LVGGEGEDILDGGAGNDKLYGGNSNDYSVGGNDTYIFGRGYGVDTIRDADTTEGNLDVIKMKEDIKPEDILIKRTGNNLELIVKGTSDKLIVEDYFSQYYGYNSSDPTKMVNKVEEVRFTDGTVWDIDYVCKAALTTTGSEGSEYISGFNDQDDIINGLAGDDTICGFAGNDSLNGGEGDDSLYADVGNDVLIGGAGDDTLVGGEGEDILDGGAGNDKLYGGNSNGYSVGGNDTYIFGRGYGVDTIRDADTTEGNLDVIKMKEDIKPEDILIKRTGNNLELIVKGTTDKLIVEDYFSQYYGYNSSDPTKMVNKVEEVRFTDGTVWDIDYVCKAALTTTGSEGSEYISGFNDQDDIINGLAGNDSIYGYAGNDSLYGGEGDDSLYADVGNDVLIGGAGDDTLVGGEGEDILDGGAGNDKLYGGNSNGYSVGGNDTYIFGRGYGVDTIRDADTTEGNLDVIKMKEDIKPEDILIKRTGNNLELIVKGTTDKLIVEDYFSQYYGYNSSDPTKMVNKVEEVRFTDGTVWDIDYVCKAALTTTGSEGSEYISGFNDQDDIINGLAGNDSIYGYAGNDSLYGGEGDDSLYADVGNDVLIGGAGDDTLVGGEGEDILDGGAGNDKLYGGNSNGYSVGGNDTYIFGRGYGVDTIRDADTTEGNLDVIKMKEDIKPEDILIKRTGNNLELIVKGTSDKLIVEDYFSQYYGYNSSDPTKMVNKVEEVRFTDGTVWDIDYVCKAALTTTGSEGSEYISGFNDQDDIINGLAGDDTICGFAGNDSLNGGEGDDSLYADVGNDVLIGGAGDDTLVGGEGEDILDGGAGNDKLYGGNSNGYSVGGNDTYIFGRGYGVDTIRDADTTEGNLDVIKMKEDIKPEDILIKRTGNNLELIVKGTSDKLIVEDYFSQYYGYNSSDPTKMVNKVEEVRFTDGTVWDIDYVCKAALTTTGSEGSEYISGFNDQDDIINGLAGDDSTYGYAGNDSLYGGEGNDNLTGDDGEDILEGGTGDDRLYGGVGNDYLDGGSGNDYLEGGIGNDTYIFGRNSGNDTIFENDRTPDNRDRVIFGEEQLNLIFSRSGNDMKISLTGAEDTLTINSWYSGRENRVEEFKTPDGSIITHNQVEQLIQAMATFTEQRGMSWNQAINDRPDDVRNVLDQFWVRQQV
ncbi:calcium-binding protein, partial [Catonella morbi]|uniref:calcium-binding protein n=1 Tax=Catonella morbi TaxID=43997 RepID=UPI00241870E0